MESALSQVAKEIGEIDEVQKRFRKAEAYNEVAEMELFGDDEEAEKYEVEAEIRAFAKERMRVYLGMQPDTRGSTPVPVAVELPFTDQQIQVLASWADGLIQRPQLLAAATAAPTRGRPAESTPTPAQPAPAAMAPVRQPAAAEPGKRGRGRPPGTGKNQRAAATQQPTPPAPSLPKKLPVGAEIDPQTGRPYLEVETIDEKGNAVVKRIDVKDQATPQGAQPLPWPTGHSPLETVNPVTQMRISNGMESGNSSMSLDGQLSQAIKRFQ
jgi:hypothetical protein